MKITKVGKTEYGRPIIHFEGLGYWIVPAFLSTSLFTVKGRRYLKLLYCYGEGQVTIGTIHTESDVDKIKSTIERVLDYLEERTPGFYHANAKQRTFSTEPYLIVSKESGSTAVRWHAPDPLVRLNKALRADNYIGSSTSPTAIEKMRQQAIRLREQCVAEFDDYFKVTRKVASAFSYHYPAAL